MGNTWDVVSQGGQLYLRVQAWHLCRLCRRGHITVTQDDRFLRLENMDGSPVLHRR